VLCKARKEPLDLIISRADYHDKLYGFWLAQCIANWTGLVTEMDKIGNIGEPKTGDFYTRDDWGQPDQPSIWVEGIPSDISPTIDFVFSDTTEIWGADDDTDIEYMYKYFLKIFLINFRFNFIYQLFINNLIFLAHSNCIAV
jgi:hypothetical protein